MTDKIMCVALFQIRYGNKRYEIGDLFDAERSHAIDLRDMRLVDWVEYLAPSETSEPKED